MSDNARFGDGLPLIVERDNECQLCRLLDHRSEEINEPEGTVVIPRDDGGLKTIHCCYRCADELWGNESGWTPYDDGAQCDGGSTRHEDEIDEERLVCSDTEDKPHHRSSVSEGYFEKNEHQWRETRGLTCIVCGAKMVPMDGGHDV